MSAKEEWSPFCCWCRFGRIHRCRSHLRRRSFLERLNWLLVWLLFAGQWLVGWARFAFEVLLAHLEARCLAWLQNSELVWHLCRRASFCLDFETCSRARHSSYRLSLIPSWPSNCQQSLHHPLWLEQLEACYQAWIPLVHPLLLIT